MFSAYFSWLNHIHPCSIPDPYTYNRHPINLEFSWIMNHLDLESRIRFTSCSAGAVSNLGSLGATHLGALEALSMLS